MVHCKTCSECKRNTLTVSSISMNLEKQYSQQVHAIQKKGNKREKEMTSCCTRHQTVTNARSEECAPFTYPESLRRTGIVDEVTPIGVAVRPTRHQKLQRRKREIEKHTYTHTIERITCMMQQRQSSQITNLINHIEGKRHNAEVIHDHDALEVKGLAVLHQPRTQRCHEVDVGSDDDGLGERGGHKKPVPSPWIYK